MMFVLDSSAVLAVLFEERGAALVQDHLAAASVCSVNVTEIISRLIDEHWGVGDALAAVDELGVDVVPFDRALSLRAGAMREMTRKRGLSLGDRACLSLAERAGLPVLTGDHAWTGLEIGVKIHFFR